MSTSEPMTKVKTKACINCGKTTWIELPTEGLKRYNAGVLAQDAFRGVDVDTRELFISGIHPRCWQEMGFNDE